MPLEPGSSAGRTNVVRGRVSFTGSSSGADGGLGLSMTKVPDGSLSALKSQKLLVDRDGFRLYVTESVRAAALDTAGYPAAIDPDTYLIR